VNLIVRCLEGEQRQAAIRVPQPHCPVCRAGNEEVRLEGAPLHIVDWAHVALVALQVLFTVGCGALVDPAILRRCTRRSHGSASCTQACTSGTATPSVTTRRGLISAAGALPLCSIRSTPGESFASTCELMLVIVKTMSTGEHLSLRQPEDSAVTACPHVNATERRCTHFTFPVAYHINRESKQTRGVSPGLQDTSSGL
jgi:hypothetical protein